MDKLWNADERAAVNQMFYYSFVGSMHTLSTELNSFAENTGVDEIMITTHVFDVNAKIRSLELTASLFKGNTVESLV
jgi:hypothetical protein